MTDEFHVAGDADTWCTKCKMWLAHTIVAMVNDVPKRVKCNTCGGEHVYRPNPPGEKPAKRTPGVRRGRSTPATTATRRKSDWERRVGGQDPRKARVYSTKETFKFEQLLDHKTFGIGLVEKVLAGGKIQVLFEAGDKVLIHSR